MNRPQRRRSSANGAKLLGTPSKRGSPSHSLRYVSISPRSRHSLPLPYADVPLTFKGNYLTSSDTLADPPTPLLAYFPSAELPVEPGARFAELFLARPRWKVEEIAPFLADVAVDTKERDKLLLKHARAVTDADGIWYTARAKYSA